MSPLYQITVTAGVVDGKQQVLIATIAMITMITMVTTWNSECSEAGHEAGDMSPNLCLPMPGNPPLPATIRLEETTPDTLSIRLQAVPQADRQEVWEKVRGRLRPYLAAQGAPGARLELAPEMPRQDSISGKFRQVWATLDAGHVEKS